MGTLLYGLELTPHFTEFFHSRSDEIQCYKWWFARANHHLPWWRGWWTVAACCGTWSPTAKSILPRCFRWLQVSSLDLLLHWWRCLVMFATWFLHSLKFHEVHWTVNYSARKVLEICCFDYCSLISQIKNNEQGQPTFLLIIVTIMCSDFFSAEHHWVFGNLC